MGRQGRHPEALYKFEQKAAEAWRVLFFEQKLNATSYRCRRAAIALDLRALMRLCSSILFLPWWVYGVFFAVRARTS